MDWKGWAGRFGPGAAGGLVVAVLFLLLFGRPQSSATHGQPPYVEIAAVLLLVIAALFALLVEGSQIYSKLKLADRQEALALPPGSIRALIAIMLVVVFPILAVFVLGSVAETDRKDLGLQLITATSTLVVAVAAFYFGSRSVETASRSLGRRERVKVLRPKDGSLLTRSTDGNLEPQRVVVATDPDDASLVATIRRGDDAGHVVLDSATGDFVYTPATPSPGSEIVLRFALADRGSVFGELTVRVPDEQRAGQPAAGAEPATADDPTAE